MCLLTTEKFPKSSRATMLAVWLVLCFFCASSPAATLTWDQNGSISGTGGNGATGNWFGTGLWNDGANQVTWTNAPLNDAVLGGSAGTISLGSPVLVGSLDVQTSNYKITTANSNSLTATSVSLANGVNLTLERTGTGASTFSLGSVAGGSTEGLNLHASPSTANEFRMNISGSVAVPTTITSAGTGPIGFVSLSNAATIDGKITNSSSSPTLLGASTSSSLITVNAEITGTAGIFAAITGAGGNGAGTIRLAAPTTFTGTTTINLAASGIFDLTSNDALRSTSAINLRNGSLVLSGGVGVTNRLNDAAPVSLGGSSGTSSSSITLSGNVVESAGVLTLAGTASDVRIIDFGTTSGILTFDKIASDAASLPLKIYNWSGIPTTGGGTDRLIATNGFGNNIVLSNVEFFSGAGGSTSLGFASWVSGTTGELVPLAPVPEPAALASLVGVVGACMNRNRRAAQRARKLLSNNV